MTVAAPAAGAAWWLSSQFSKLNDKLDAKFDKLEMEVKAVASKQDFMMGVLCCAAAGGVVLLFWQRR